MDRRAETDLATSGGVAVSCGVCAATAVVNSRSAFTRFDDEHRTSCKSSVLDPEHVEAILGLPPWD
jgi:hypothetical protein